MNLATFKDSFDKILLGFLDQKLRNLPDAPGDIKTYLSYLKTFLVEGKRIRPYISYLSYKSNGGKHDDKAIKLLVFLEVFHAFCLVHDDVMDKSYKRHGVKTIHKFISDKYLGNRFVDPTHFGNSNAILLGDFLFTWANEVLLTNKDFDKESVSRVYGVYKQMINDVFLGQMIDLTITSKDKVTDEEILQKYLLKTAKYSFVGPMMIGAALVGEVKNEKFYEDFGISLGLAFQIQDDLMDLVFDEKQIKKSSLNDIERHQHTLFTNYIFEKGTKEQINTLKNLFGKKLDKKDRLKLRNIFYESGAVEYGKKIIADNLSEAKNLLEKQKINEEYKKLFLKLIFQIENRGN